jgi:hypothetical protein
MVNVYETRKSIVTNDKKDAFNLGDSVFVVPRIRSIKEQAAENQFWIVNGALQELLRY